MSLKLAESRKVWTSKIQEGKAEKELGRVSEDDKTGAENKEDMQGLCLCNTQSNENIFKSSCLDFHLNQHEMTASDTELNCEYFKGSFCVQHFFKNSKQTSECPVKYN